MYPLILKTRHHGKQVSRTRASKRARTRETLTPVYEAEATVKGVQISLVTIMFIVALCLFAVASILHVAYAMKFPQSYTSKQLGGMLALNLLIPIPYAGIAPFIALVAWIGVSMKSS